MKSIGVVGAGQMGSGITQSFAMAGYSILLYDVIDGKLKSAMKGIEANLDKLIKKGRITESEKINSISNISLVNDLNNFNESDTIIEAVSEDEKLKIDLFKQLDNIAKSDAILASNTSSISITRLASVTKRPNQVIGLHFMNPVPLMKLVEIIKGHDTSENTFEIAKQYVKTLGKEFCVSEDYPAFIVNRILIPMINEAIFAVFEGVGRPEEIDKGMKLGTNQPMGPLTLADFIGLDTCLAVMNVLFSGFKEPKYRPCPLLVKMVEAGHLGQKTGIGFYKY